VQFREEALTGAFNAHGALLLLYAKVQPGQKLWLMNPTTWDEQSARVVFCAPAHRGLNYTAVEFLNCAPQFWPVDPPGDWKSARQVLATSTSAS